MAKIELPYIQQFVDRYGKIRRCYFRKKGMKRIRLPGEIGSKEFMEVYSNALGKVDKRSIGSEKAKPGTLSALLVEFYRSAYWNNLKDNTKRGHKNIYERLRLQYGDQLVINLTRKDIYIFLDDRSATPAAARSFFLRLRILLNFAVEREWIKASPAEEIKVPSVSTDGFRAWTDDDIAKFESFYPLDSREILALRLLLYTGQRRSDVVNMGRQHVTGDKIHVLQTKGQRGKPRVRLAIPIHRDLRSVLDHGPADNLTFLLTRSGRRISAEGFTNWFAEAARNAGLPKGSTPHGLRKAAARRLAEAGCSPHEIMAITGHQSLQEVDRYTKSVNQERAAESAMKKVEGHAPGT